MRVGIRFVSVALLSGVLLALGLVGTRSTSINIFWTADGELAYAVDLAPNPRGASFAIGTVGTVQNVNGCLVVRPEANATDTFSDYVVPVFPWWTETAPALHSGDSVALRGGSIEFAPRQASIPPQCRAIGRFQIVAEARPFEKGSAIFTGNNATFDGRYKLATSSDGDYSGWGTEVWLTRDIVSVAGCLLMESSEGDLWLPIFPSDDLNSRFLREGSQVVTNIIVQSANPLFRQVVHIPSGCPTDVPLDFATPVATHLPN